MGPESKRKIAREAGGRLGGDGSRGQRDSSLFCRGVNPVPVPGYWTKPGTGTGVPGYCILVTGTGTGTPVNRGPWLTGFYPVTRFSRPNKNYNTYKLDRNTWICNRKSQIFIPLRIDVLLHYTSLQLLHQKTFFMIKASKIQNVR